MRRKKASAWWLALVVFAIGIPGLAYAQSTATLRGTVTDPQGAVTPGASVVIRNQDTGVERTVFSDESGVYVAPSLPPGRYRVEVQLQGFQTQAKEVAVGPAETLLSI